MALSEQQKAENRAARLVRERAHSARAKQYRSAMQAAKQSPEVVQAHTWMEACNMAFDARVEHRRASERALREQIAALEAQIQALGTDPELEALREKRLEANNAWRSATSKHERAVDAQFPDMAGDAEFSAALWKPPAEVLAAMDEARKVATPLPKAVGGSPRGS